MMEALFEFLFKYRPVAFEKGAVAIHPPWPTAVTVLLALAAVALPYLYYRRVDNVTPAWRSLLVLLRSVAFLVVLFLLMQPRLLVRTVLPQKNFLAVAYDVSKSMEIKDAAGGGSRLDQERQLLRPEGNPMLDALAQKFKLRYFRFAGTAERATGVEDPPRHGNVTDLKRALSQIVAEIGNAPVSGVVLVTDGGDNQPGDLQAVLGQLKARNIPVFPVGLGASRHSRDVEIIRVSAPKKVLKDAIIEAEVSVRSKGYAGRRSRLLVSEGARAVYSQEIVLGGDEEVKTYKVNFSSEAVGPRVFSFKVESFEDEIIAENNSQEHLMRVEDVQPKILYVEGEPRWEHGFLRRAVQDDKNLRLVSLLRQAEGKYYRQGIDAPAMLEKGFPAEKSELYQFKGLILGSIEASFFTFDQLRLISDFVSERGGSFLMLGGRQSFAQGGYANTPLEDLLPLRIRFGSSPADIPPFRDDEFRVRLTDYGSSHAVTRLSVSEEENRRRWEAVPTLVGLNPTLGPKPGAVVLAESAVPDARRQYPAILAFQRYGRGKSVALTTESTWRWRMELDHADKTHEIFWKQMLRWLVSDVPDAVGFESEKTSYSPDESVQLRAEVRDADFIHLNNAQISATVRAPSGQLSTLQLQWDVNHEGEYIGFFKPQEEGTYEVSADAAQGKKPLGNARANFRVAESTREFHEATLNEQFLRQMASETGGRYYTPDALSSLPEDISYVDTGASHIEERDLWDMPFLFLLLIAVLSSEWVLRKRKGLA